MPFRIPCFDIKHDCIRLFHELRHLRIEPGTIGIQETGFIHGMDFLEEIRQKFRIGGAFSSGYRDAFDEREGQLKSFCNIIRCHPGDLRRREMSAGMDAGVAHDTGILVPYDFMVLHGQCFRSRRAGGDAFSAADAHGDGFRIMTVKTAERTALNKNGGPVSRAVHIGELDDPVNGCSPLHVRSCDPERLQYCVLPDRIQSSCSWTVHRGPALQARSS